MKETFYIYHIPSVKIGVSKNPSRRTMKQGYDYFEILETHTDIIEVSHREIELQKQYGYSVDAYPYYKFVDGRASKAGKAAMAGVHGKRIRSMGGATGAGGKAAMAGVHGERIRSLGGKVGGKIRAATMTFEERSHAGKLGGKLASQNLETFMGGYVTCKHCSKTMNVGNHNRWHGNKCKNKKEL